MNSNLKKLVVAAMLVALGFVTSGIYIPLGTSKCFPVQHMINVLCAVILGPWYGVGTAFCISILRNLAGTGTLLAFPGSMVGALICGLVYKFLKNQWAAFAGEIIGTGVIGAMLAFPVAALIMNNADAALFTYVIPFSISTAGGTIIGAILLVALQQSGAMRYVNDMLGNYPKK